ncbi:AAA family ATPase [Rhodococcus qingshengii]|uniref:AAA family ATPase n=1 Tax=Rhodococcus qingshengii TaxID=334542 RepID=UPI0035A63938
MMTFSTNPGGKSSVHIERLQVEAEGFLAGLDLRFSPGLNVIIGARGTGKTSIVELIRFCTGAGAFTEKAKTQGNQQAIAILDGGAVTLTIRDNDSIYTISRSASGHTSTSPGAGNISCTVLAQNEIEAVGAQTAGRLHLLDRFRVDREVRERNIDSFRSQLRSLTTEISTLISDGRAISEEIESLQPIESELAAARQHQQRLLEDSQATQEQQTELKDLQEIGQRIAMRESVLEQDKSHVKEFQSQLDRLRSATTQILMPWPSHAGNDLIADDRPRLDHISYLLQQAAGELLAIEQGITNAAESTTSLRAVIDVQSRQVRQQLDTVQTGIGQASQRVAELEEKHGRLEALKNLLTIRAERFHSIASDRNEIYTKLDLLRDEIFRERDAVATKLNSSLAPTVRIRMSRSENSEQYRASIVSGLRGSGIHYNSLAPQIAREVSPHELVTWIENGTYENLSAALGIAPERASSVIRALQHQATADIISAIIEDGATLELLDGPEYKPSDRLSIGQRCTVVLPILLGHHGDPLILDQPEDHLDNAFIASTLVSALRKRLPKDQFIFTSHNANIPVLGEADRVIAMNSDGEHGFVSHQGSLDEISTVQAVTKIMEGGVEAFETRSEFYQRERDAK